MNIALFSMDAYNSALYQGLYISRRNNCQNNMLSVMGEMVWEEILKKVKQAGLFSIIIDTWLNRKMIESLYQQFNCNLVINSKLLLGKMEIWFIIPIQVMWIVNFILHIVFSYVHQHVCLKFQHGIYTESNLSKSYSKPV